MSECFGRYFIKNGEIMDSELFNDDNIKRGRSIYEVIRIIDRVPLFLEKHLERLANSAVLMNCSMLLDFQGIKENMEKLIAAEEICCGNIKLVFNYKDIENNYLFYLFKHSYPKPELYLTGVPTVLYHGERQNPNAKVINTHFKEKVEAKIKDDNAYEAILVDNEGYITEGSKSNIFMVVDGKVVTSPVEAVLPGVTRNIIIDLIQSAHIEFNEERIHYTQLNSINGLFITGTSPKVLPICSVDNMGFNSSENKIIKKIMYLYNKEVKEYIDRRNI